MTKYAIAREEWHKHSLIDLTWQMEAYINLALDDALDLNLTSGEIEDIKESIIKLQNALLDVISG